MFKKNLRKDKAIKLARINPNDFVGKYVKVTDSYPNSADQFRYYRLDSYDDSENNYDPTLKDRKIETILRYKGIELNYHLLGDAPIGYFWCRNQQTYIEEISRDDFIAIAKSQISPNIIDLINWDKI